MLGFLLCNYGKSSPDLVEDDADACHDKPIEGHHNAGNNKKMFAISIGLEEWLVDVISHLRRE